MKDAARICDLLQQLAGRQPGEEPSWELVAAVQLLVAVISHEDSRRLSEHFSRRLNAGWKGVITPKGAKLLEPFDRVCNHEEPHHR